MQMRRHAGKKNVITTRSYRLNKSQYIWLGLKSILRRQWWAVGLLALLTGGVTYYMMQWRWLIGGSLLLALYFLFWIAQFYGVSNMEENKLFFELLSYEISQDGVVVFVTKKHGMPLTWSQFTYAYRKGDDFLLFLSILQFIHLPAHVMSGLDRNRLDRWLRDRSLL